MESRAEVSISPPSTLSRFSTQDKVLVPSVVPRLLSSGIEVVT